MYPEAYKEWIALFNDDLVEIWQCERKELQKVAVLFCALQKELKDVQTNVEIELSNLKQQLKHKDDLDKQIKSQEIAKKKSPNIVNKENNLEKQIRLKEVGDIPIRKNQVENESPDLFKNIDLNAHCSSTDMSIIDLSISEDDTTKVDGSPTIKKRRKRYKVIPNSPTFNVIVESDEKPGTPVSNIRESVKANLFKTPIPKFDHDFSVIDGTPEITSRRSKTSSRIGDFLSKKKAKNKRNNNSTLTQMFRRASVTATNEKPEDGADSDETYFDDNTDETKMGITELISYINKDESGKQGNSIFTVHRNEAGESTYEALDTSSQEVDQFSKGAIFNEEELHTSTEIPKIVNIEPEPIVRGNARKQLHGWSCQQCKNFYGQMKLPPEELQKKMDDCSRHRYKYRPPEETMPGFWDLSIPPEKS